MRRSPLSRLVKMTRWAGREGEPYDWDAVRAELGTDLPADYVELVDTFGAGWFDEEIGLPEPGVSTFPFGLVPLVKARQLALYEYLDFMRSRWNGMSEADIPEDEIPLSIRGRDPIMAWGFSTFALYFFWRCSPWDQPDTWPVAVNVLGESWDEYTMSATELLSRVISGSRRVKNLDLVLPRRQHAFVPHTR